jgi:hypothetical protein
MNHNGTTTQVGRKPMEDNCYYDGTGCWTWPDVLSSSATPWYVQLQHGRHSVYMSCMHMPCTYVWQGLHVLGVLSCQADAYMCIQEAATQQAAQSQ